MRPKILYTNEDACSYTNKSFIYLLWFQPGKWFMILSEDKLIIILNPLDFEKKHKVNLNNIYEKLWNSVNVEFIKQTRDKKIEDIIKENVEDREISIEDTWSLQFYNSLLNFWFDVKLVSPIFDKNRIIKTETEINNIKKAVKIIEKVWKEIEKQNKAWELIWKTEVQIRQFIIQKIFEFGWEWESFESIVAFWPNTAIPHHETWNTKIKEWPLLVDMWAIYNWYISDFTRTLWVWEKWSEEYKDFCLIQKIVKKAHDEWVNHIAHWIKLSEIDKKVRDYIESEWLWEYFTHSTGHWVWLNVHEAPFVANSSNDIIKPWMTFTIEPGIYIPWKFWVRYENIVIVD